MNWRWLINHVATGLGRLPSEVARDVTLPEAQSLMDYWQEFPAPHLSLRRLAVVQAHWEPQKSENTPTVEAKHDDFGVLVGMFNAEGGTLSAM